jgi:hypothetical protein
MSRTSHDLLGSITAAPVFGSLAETDAHALEGVTTLLAGSTPANTNRAYKVKNFEWFKFSDHVHPQLAEANRYLVSEQKLFPFVWHHSFRNKQKGGKNKCKHSESDGRFMYFCPSEFEELVMQHNQCAAHGAAPPESQCGTSYQDFNTTKSALKLLWQEQVDSGINNKPWDLVWTDKLLQLKATMVHGCKTRIVKCTYQEKLTLSLPPTCL